MTDLVDPADIERIVGRPRSFRDHFRPNEAIVLFSGNP